jgi:hypothetical protein
MLRKKEEEEIYRETWICRILAIRARKARVKRKYRSTTEGRKMSFSDLGGGGVISCKLYVADGST